MASGDSYLEENIFEVEQQRHDLVEDVEMFDQQRQSEQQRDTGVFSQVSMKVYEVIQSTKEKLFGEDYWIPADPYEVVSFPSDFVLRTNKPVYPEHQNVLNMSLIIVQGVMKCDPTIPIYHVVYSYHDGTLRHSLSIFRTNNFEESMDFFQRCEECRLLLRMLDKKKDIRKLIRDITEQIHQHPLWKMVHIAIVCQRLDLFSESGLRVLKDNGYSEKDLTNLVCVPEGRYPLMLAIERNQQQIVKFLLSIGANPAACDPHGNNALHCASLVSSQMLEILFTYESAKTLIDLPNNDGLSPAWIAIRNGNFLILRTLAMSHGASLVNASGKNALFEALQSNKTSKDVIRVLLDSSPDLLTKQDDATGNTCLHVAQFKTPLSNLLQLKAKELDLNVKNKSGLAAIHLFVTRGDLGMVMTLSSYGCNLDEPGEFNGATALHIAVSNRNLWLTRLLLCLGADPNVADFHGDTPRHHAALMKDNDLLQSLSICGAKRCPPTKAGCLSGCVSENKRLNLVKTTSSPTMNIEDKQKQQAPSPKGVSSQSQPPLSPPQCVPSAVDDSEIQKVKWRHHQNWIQEAEQQSIYKQILEKLESMDEEARTSAPHFINVLSLDGGGIRGLVITQILIELEKVLGGPFFDYFDWIAGTSTGTLVASGLTTGQTLRQIQWIYLRFKDQIFENWIRPYNDAILEAFIQAEIGETRLSDMRWPRLMYSTVRADIFPVQLELMRNYRLPLTTEENEELGFIDPKDIFLWKALRRSSAAPTYFSWVDGKYVDGGLISNNPTLEILSEIQLWNSVVRRTEKPESSVKIGCLLSVGTGIIPTVPIHLQSVGLRSPVTSYVSIKNLGLIVVDQVTATEGVPVYRSSSWCIETGTPYFRLNAPLFKEVAMDNKDDMDITKMMWNSMEYAHGERDTMERICCLIRKIGPSHNRRSILCSTSDQIEEAAMTSSGEIFEKEPTEAE